MITLKQGLLTLPGAGVSLLPKLMCPACWPAYAAVLSSVGLGFLISTTYLLLLTVLFLAIALGSLALRSSSRHGLGPFGGGLGAAAMILIGKFYLESPLVAYGGVGLLIFASVWNTWPRRAAVAPCSACIPTEGNVTATESRKGEVHL
jgi:hypothetical protein